MTSYLLQMNTVSFVFAIGNYSGAATCHPICSVSSRGVPVAKAERMRDRNLELEL